MRDSAKHVILGTQQFRPSEFAQQINLNMDNAWGIMRCIIDTCMKQKEGKYLIMKDPNKVRACLINVCSYSCLMQTVAQHQQAVAGSGA